MQSSCCLSFQAIPRRSRLRCENKRWTNHWKSLPGETIDNIKFSQLIGNFVIPRLDRKPGGTDENFCFGKKNFGFYLIALATLLKLVPFGDSKERRPGDHVDVDDDDVDDGDYDVDVDDVDY